MAPSSVPTIGIDTDDILEAGSQPTKVGTTIAHVSRIGSAKVTPTISDASRTQACDMHTLKSIFGKGRMIRTMAGRFVLMDSYQGSPVSIVLSHSSKLER